jgi:hypothetical protein
VIEEIGATYIIEVPIDDFSGFSGQWIYANRLLEDHLGTLEIEEWRRCIALVVEYEPYADGTSAIDDSIYEGGEAGAFVFSVADGAARNYPWTQYALTDADVEHVPYERFIFTVKDKDMDIINHIGSFGYGAWTGADQITRIYFVFTEGD